MSIKNFFSNLLGCSSNKNVSEGNILEITINLDKPSENVDSNTWTNIESVSDLINELSSEQDNVTHNNSVDENVVETPKVSFNQLFLNYFSFLYKNNNEQSVEPIAELPIEPVAEPSTEPSVESVTEPSVESVIKLVVESVLESFVEPVTEPVVEPVVE